MTSLAVYTVGTRAISSRSFMVPLQDYGTETFACFPIGNCVFCADGIFLRSYYLCLNVSCSPGHCNAVVVERGYLWCKHATKLVQLSRECKSSLVDACAVLVCGDADASQRTVVQHNCFWLRLNGMGCAMCFSFVCAANSVCFR
jgi:hypothetical protein